MFEPHAKVPHPSGCASSANRDDTRKQTKISSFFDKENTSSKNRRCETGGHVKSMTPVVARSKQLVPSAKAPHESITEEDRTIKLRSVAPSREHGARAEPPKVDNAVPRRWRGILKSNNPSSARPSRISCDLPLVGGPWRVLEVRDDDTPGLLTCFVVTDDGCCSGPRSGRPAFLCRCG